MKQDDTMAKLIALAKRRGFIYQGSEVYGGLSGTWDYGPLGVALKRKIINRFWQTFIDGRDDMYGVDAAILMNQKVWRASGHVETFVDPLCEDVVTKKRYRTDHVLKDNGLSADGLTMAEMDALIIEKGIKSPDGNPLSASRVFNMMFKTNVGPADDMLYISKQTPEYYEVSNSDQFILIDKKECEIKAGGLLDNPATSYLRPETAQGIFTNYRNVVDCFYPDLPFGIGQVGKAFRNEISPRDFVFRSREFEQMEIEYFVNPNDWERAFEEWRQAFWNFLTGLGLPKEAIHELEVPEADRAHYSKRTIDFEFDYPGLGQEELMGIAYRTDFDLNNIERASGKKMDYLVKGSNERFVPHVIEPSIGVERLLMAVLATAYTEDQVGGETRVVLRLPEELAPVRYCVSPLLKNKPALVEKAREVYRALKQKYGNVVWDDNGNIGKRYRRQDEIGTPYCVVVDFDSLEDDTVTVRERDTAEQKRVAISELIG